MNPTSLPFDDLPPLELEESDSSLGRQLEEALSRYFYESCDGVTQALLTNCEWCFTTISTAPTLVINGADRAMSQRVLNHVVAISTALLHFSTSARVLIGSSSEAETLIEIRVDEISAY
ncbi:hypothetical protein C7B65_05965 [Phormidesmis priestleyi ULC007]|uniref:Uncharacterized protein n=1 Tax=Phormidesmis priestleyi ULC007 TaxID=1920490 RepID=A0A2T1DKC7_9CYAN|nr:hypothetical protein [Phormidesmis priestleyi]PSB20949.1 hypothetical protein C7B65_05965 [Phormidesmis priestleyi ULC007]PZO51904.1 MAG: hypothetical protein DCF14_08110 [Phormidesmis priestleyi]